jgi:putative ATP-dependent endonuclease of OLD family
VYLSTVSVTGFRAGATDTFACTFPGRFGVLLGANNAGKTTVCDALYLAHPHRFPQLPRPSVAALGDAPRTIDIAFAFEKDDIEGPLGKSLLAQSQPPPGWSRSLERSLGSVRAVNIDNSQHVDSTRLIYLPAHRNPVDELARREAEVLVELLRAEQDRRHGHRNLADLRGLAAHLLDGLVSHELIRSVESRVSEYLVYLTGGVSRHHAFVGRQDVDDAFLARVLEFLLAAVDQRVMAQRLEVSGLGYVNLLHIAITLAAVPGGGDTAFDQSPPSDIDDTPPESTSTDGEDVLAEDRIDRADAEAQTIEDSFFPELFHATIVIEEREAHLHPQLQHGLMRYLRRTTLERPELQLIVSTHSGEMTSACEPADLVVLRRDAQGRRVARLVASLPLAEDQLKRILRLTSLHLDATRSASLFANHLVLVEGVTDAMLLRQLGLAWAGDDTSRRDFIEALTIAIVGSKVGEWTVQLLATPGHELVTRVAVLRDSDDRTGAEPATPDWITTYDANTVRCFLNHPTLEPAVTPGNESLVLKAIETLGLAVPVPVTSEGVDELFRTTGRGRKGEFAFALAAGIREATANGAIVVVPTHLADLFSYLQAAIAFRDSPPADATTDAH